ncbi:peptidase M1 [Kineobactrum sediminis]|uniref:Aminopeptidase N n=1 Tax=Kineobactrum sediminis TaxID=1905677 RepID=A0A2N5XYF2_9GAMM|nr:M1 family aminopeptidase [Kineobactrum sediminis]PLW81171.1 peptidase M1 [Kineobactrum sediminis]
MRVVLWFTVSLLGFTLMACKQEMPLPIEPGVSLALAEQRARRLADIHYELYFEIPADQQAGIAGRAVISFTLTEPEKDLQLDFRAEADAVHRLVVNGEPLVPLLQEEHLVIPAAALQPGPNTVELDFTAGDASLNRNPDYLYTLFVPDRARTALPLFDQPDLKATWDLTLALPESWVALANAPLLATRDGEPGQTVHQFATSELISSYVFSFVAGRFEVVTREYEGRPITLLHRETDDARVARNLEAIFDLHWAALDWLEDYTGIAHPFTKLDLALLPAFQYGGMEHPGAIQYRAELLLLDESPTDEEQLRRASLIAHEVAHMWFGNLVTMRWFNDVWTKEVFANFMAAKIVNPQFPQIDHELSFLLRHYPAAYAVDRSAGSNPIRQPLANLNEAGQLYGPIIYNKAPIMMRQLEQLLGPVAFRAGIGEYLRAHAYGNASWPDLVAVLDSHTDTGLAAWSDEWVHSTGFPDFALQYSAGGLGYGRTPVVLSDLDAWLELEPVARGRLLLNLYEELLVGEKVLPEDYTRRLLDIIAIETNQLVLATALSQLARLQQVLLPERARNELQPVLEETLWRAVAATDDPARVRLLFDKLVALASEPGSVQRLYRIWSGEESVAQLQLSENDRIHLAAILAIRLPQQAKEIVALQHGEIINPDNRRRLEFLAPTLSPVPATRDAFFASLADPAMRATENWVLDALGYLHHPLRAGHSRRYILPSLELLQEIQVTGDIFFPSGWLHATLANHGSAEAVAIVREFLAAHPQFNAQLRMKILQALDMPARAARLRT